MTCQVRSAGGRLLALVGLAVFALVARPEGLSAQGSTGKIQGTVTDQAGAPVGGAQVLIVGTAFGAVADAKGYYFINNVPAGTYTLRAQFIGYAQAQVTGVRVLAEQTLTVNVTMQSSAVVVSGVTVTAAAQEIVPRDQVTSKTIVSGQLIDRLPVNDVREVLGLQPGVVESGNAKGVSIRGGRPGEAAFYVDGVLVRNSQAGETDLRVGTNAVEEASVTTGALGAEFGEAQSGIIAMVTRAGGQKYQGAFSYQTDDLGLWDNVGFNRFEASLGGPVPSIAGLTFFVAATANGQKSVETPLNAPSERPMFVMSGIDTIVRQPATFGDPLSDTVSIAIPRFVQYDGTCGQYGAADAPVNDTTSQARVAQAIRNNYGVECQGLRRPFSANGGMTLNGKLQYTYGSGSRISVSGLTSAQQQRDLPGLSLYNPNNYTGTRNTSYAAIANWTQNLARSSDRAMALDLNLSYQVDKSVNGPLTRQSELDSRDPFGGFMLAPLDFLYGFDFKHDVRIATTTYADVGLLGDRQIQCLTAGEGNCQDDVPFLNHNELLSAQPYRMNPYAVEQSARFPMYTQGQDNAVFLSREARWQLRGNFDWQADRYNRVKLGAEFHTFDTRRYNAPFGVITTFFVNAYHEKPVRYGAYAEDRLDLGDVVIVGGVRYDSYDSRAKYPFTPGRISSDTLPLDPNEPDANFVRAPSHHAWSPRVQVSFPVTETTNFRLSYSHQVQSPDFDVMFQSKNTDVAFSNQNNPYGRDLDFTKTILFEFGIRHAFNQDMVLDVAAYNKEKVSDVAFRLFQLPDPHRNGQTSDFRAVTNADFGNVRGIDVKLDRRFSNLFSGSLAYTLQSAKSTGSDPFDYLNTLARQINAITGETSPPPQGVQPTNDNRTHTIAGSAALNFPGDWRSGTTLGSVLKNVGVFATFRVASGLAYTRLANGGRGQTTGGFGLGGLAEDPTLNASTLPWIKNVDLRITKGIRFGRSDWTLFAESKNLFNFRNIVDLFTETGDVENAQFRDKFIDEQVAEIVSEASAASILTTFNGEQAVDFRGYSCAGWDGRLSSAPGSASSGPVDCVLLNRAEARYGNGDGVFTETEYRAAFDAWYSLRNGPSRFYGPGRRIRLGVEISF